MANRAQTDPDGRSIGHLRGDLLEHRELLSYRATRSPHAGEIAPSSQTVNSSISHQRASARIRRSRYFRRTPMRCYFCSKAPSPIYLEPNDAWFMRRAASSAACADISDVRRAL